MCEKRETMQVRISNDLHSRLKIEAAKRNMTISRYADELILQGLEDKSGNGQSRSPASKDELSSINPDEENDN